MVFKNKNEAVIEASLRDEVLHVSALAEHFDVGGIHFKPANVCEDTRPELGLTTSAMREKSAEGNEKHFKLIVYQ